MSVKMVTFTGVAAYLNAGEIRMADKKVDEMSFEEALGELESIVEKLERGDAPLEKVIVKPDLERLLILPNFRANQHSAIINAYCAVQTTYA